MATHDITIDRSRRLAEEPASGHNRWHPDVAPALRVAPGDEVFAETRDALDGQITRDSSHADAGRVDFGVVHALTGPVFVEGAEPGDLLQVELLEITTGSFGFSLVSPGFGFLRDEFPEPFCARWDIAGDAATSEDVPGVRVPSAPFLGIIGVAPSRQLLQRCEARERSLASAGGVANPPDPAGAVPAAGPVASEGLRTIPPRENGGNVDIKQLTAGTRLLLPVYVPGALLSVGDGHFAQGDGEVCGTAIEVAGAVRARLGLLKGAASERGIGGISFEHRAPAQPVERSYFATTGLCIHDDGRNAMEDVTLAARQALRAMISHLVAEYGYSRQQAYVICSVAVDLKVSQLVDVPNVSVSAFLPLDILVT